MAHEYHDGQRDLQDRFDTRRLADRLAEASNDSIGDAHRLFIEARDMVFVATADEHGAPQCSYKGGEPGFVRVVDDTTVAMPVYDGNGMFLSMGNASENPQVGLLFIDFETPKRLRVNGRATIDPDDPLVPTFDGAQLVVRVRAEHVFPNCPRYVHSMALRELSVYVPAPRHEPPVPAWKQMDAFRDCLPRKA